MNTHTQPASRLQQKLESFNSTQLIKWLAWILVIAVLISLLVPGFYWAFFDGEISAKQEHWGTFGDYVGGILNPLFSLLALLALLLTIILQNRQLEISKQELIASRKELELTRGELQKTAEAAVKQAKHFEDESKRADLYRLIEKLAGRINNNYNENRLDKNSSIHAVMRGNKNPSKNIALMDMLRAYEDKSSPTFNTVRWIENDLQRLATYISRYEKVSNQGGTPLPEFYRAEFGDMVQLLVTHEMISQILLDFYCPTSTGAATGSPQTE